MHEPAAGNRGGFISSLRAELAAFRESHQILQAEQECLQRSDVDARPTITHRKSQQLERLAALATMHTVYLDFLHLTPNRAGVAQWLALHPGHEAPELSDTLEPASEACWRGLRVERIPRHPDRDAAQS